MPDNLQSLIRAALNALGGYAVANGLVTDTQWTSLGGAILVLLSLAWSWYSNRQTNAAKTVSAAVGAPVVVPLVGMPTVAAHTPTPTGAADVAKAKAA